MDNRWNERQIIHLYVMIYFGPLGLIKGVAKDISCSGMFVESGRIILSNDEVIQVSFQYPSADGDKSFTIPAHVIHSNKHGAGLQFLNYIFSPADIPPNSHYAIGQ